MSCVATVIPSLSVCMVLRAWESQHPTPVPRHTLPTSPQHIVDTHDALWLQVAWVIDDRALRLQPHIAPVLRQHAVLATHYLALGAHWRAKQSGYQ